MVLQRNTYIRCDVFFELNIGDVDKKEISVISNEQFCPSVDFNDNRVKFKGRCEQIDDVYIIRFSDDWIEMLSIDNDDFSIKTGDAVSFSINYDRVGIYPYPRNITFEEYDKTIIVVGKILQSPVCDPIDRAQKPDASTAVRMQLWNILKRKSWRCATGKPLPD